MMTMGYILFYSGTVIGIISLLWIAVRAISGASFASFMDSAEVSDKVRNSRILMLFYKIGYKSSQPKLGSYVRETSWSIVGKVCVAIFVFSGQALQMVSSIFV